MSNTRTQILDVMRQNNLDGLAFEEGRSLTENGFDSYSFIEMVVQIEGVLAIEFDDSHLDYNRYDTLGDFLDCAEGLVPARKAADVVS